MEKKLIRFMRKNPFMYDIKHSSYKNQLLKDKMWMEFSREVDFPIDVVKKRWRYLRNRFFKLRKNKAADKSKYKYYTHLLFLRGAAKTINRNKKIKFKIKVNEKAVDDISAKSEDSFLSDQANLSSFYTDSESSTSAPTSPSRSKDVTENLTPFRLFLESIALTVENANLDMDKVISLQTKILELVQSEMESHVIHID